MPAAFQGNWLFSVSGAASGTPPSSGHNDFSPRQQVPAAVQNGHWKCHLEPILVHTEAWGLSGGLMQSLLQADPGSGCTHQHLAARTCEPLYILVSAVAPTHGTSNMETW